MPSWSLVGWCHAGAKTAFADCNTAMTVLVDVVRHELSYTAVVLELASALERGPSDYPKSARSFSVEVSA
jgi:hypothetical protein